MKEITLNIHIQSYSFEELEEKDQELINKAKEATYHSYAPYSNFFVGAALLLKNGMIVSGSNQENAAYPSGLCAERTALFYANSRYPDQPVITMAVAARTAAGFIDHPIPPCGACRQVMVETVKRFSQTFRILLFGEKNIYVIAGIKDLLPLAFDSSDME